MQNITWECRDARIPCVYVCVCKHQDKFKEEMAFERTDGVSSGRVVGRGTFRSAKAHRSRWVWVLVGSAVWLWQRAMKVRSGGEAGRGSQRQRQLSPAPQARQEDGTYLIVFVQNLLLGLRVKAGSDFR